MVKYFLLILTLVFTSNVLAMGGGRNVPQMSQEEIAIREQLIELQLKINAIEDEIAEAERRTREAERRTKAARDRLKQQKKAKQVIKRNPMTHEDTQYMLSAPAMAAPVYQQPSSVQDSIDGAIVHHNVSEENRRVRQQHQDQHPQQRAEPQQQQQQRWVKPSYDRSVKRAQESVVIEKHDKCHERRNYYFQALIQNPSNIFLQTKFEEWDEICGDHVHKRGDNLDHTHGSKK